MKRRGSAVATEAEAGALFSAMPIPWPLVLARLRQFRNRFHDPGYRPVRPGKHPSLIHLDPGRQSTAVDITGVSATVGGGAVRQTLKRLRYDCLGPVSGATPPRGEQTS